MVFVLNKKRIFTITMCMALSCFMAGVATRNKTIETVALPVENKVIILDAGHGSPDERRFK